MKSKTKDRSYLELSDLPVSELGSGLKLASVLKTTKYGQISEDDKRDVIIVKEAFVFTDRKKKRVGVFTRSDKDHGTKIGECSTMLCGNFDISECTIPNDGTIVYDVKDRLHNCVREISGLFTEVKRSSIPGVYYHDKDRGKRYLFLVFELQCASSEMPFCYHLDNRAGDLFIGMHDIGDVSQGLERYNKSQFNVDRSLVQDVTTQWRRRWWPPGGGRLAIAEKLVENKLASFTLVRFSLIG